MDEHLLFLILALLGLCAGPALVWLMGKKTAWMSLVDGYVLVTIAGIGFLHILPHALSDGGSVALLAMIGGMLLPIFLEKQLTASGSVNLFLVLGGLLVHVVLDGAALSMSHSGHGEHLPHAVVFVVF